MKKRLILAVALVVLLMILAGSSGSALPGTGTTPTDSSVLDGEPTAHQTDTSNSPASAIITITMYAVDDGYFSQRIWR